MRSKYIGTILGSAIGDALGAPLEMMWKQDIAKACPDFIKNKDYVAAPSGTRRAKEGWESGKWTDDTQLMIPVGWSVIYKGGIDIQDISEQYVSIFNTEELRGWGRSTIASVTKLTKGVYWSEASDEVYGTGNGAAMKAAPLGLVLAHTLETGNITAIRHCMNSIIDVGKITHREDGIRAGFLQSVLISLAYLEKQPKYILQDLKFCESEFFGGTLLSEKIESLLQYNTVSEIAQAGGVTSVAFDSCATVAAVYLKFVNGHNDSSVLLNKLFELIAEGGDCDTTGAMLGALIGARYGTKIFPTKLKTKLEDSEILENLGIHLFHAMNGPLSGNHFNVWDNSVTIQNKLNVNIKPRKNTRTHI